MLLVRDDGDNDDTVVGEDDDEAEISTNVDSSSSSAPATGKVTVAVGVLAALVGSTFIFFLYLLVLYSGPISTFHSRFVHSQCPLATVGCSLVVFTSRSVFCLLACSIQSCAGKDL